MNDAPRINRRKITARFPAFQARRTSGTSRLLYLALLLLALGAPSQAAIFTVGTVGPCTSADIGTALIGAAFSLAEDDEIRVSAAQASVALTLINFDPAAAGAVTIRGGYTDCSDTTSASANTPISGVVGAPIFTIESTGGLDSVVVLERLTLEGSGERGILIEGSDTDVTLIDVTVQNNEGGIEISGGATLDLDFESVIANNDAGAGSFGGGINCDDSTVTTAALIRDNEATSGGGMWASTCVVNIADGGFFVSNSASWGGGLNINSGSIVIRSTFGPAGSRINDNTASMDGGGVYAAGGTTALSLVETEVRDNEAANNGGGLYVDAGALLTMDVFNSECATKSCSQLSGNTLTTTGNGSAAYAGDDATLNLFHTHVVGNSGFDDSGFALFATGSGTLLHLESVRYWNNKTVSLFQSEDSAEFLAAFVSAARNEYKLSGGGSVVDSLGGQALTNASLTLRSSVLTDHRSFIRGPAEVIDADCMIVQDGTGIDSSSWVLAIPDPLFIDADGGDLRLQPVSSAIDYCDTSAYSPSARDLAFELRGLDDPSFDDLRGPYDLGAFESTLIFIDGFESGDTTAW